MGLNMKPGYILVLAAGALLLAAAAAPQPQEPATNQPPPPAKILPGMLDPDRAKPAASRRFCRRRCRSRRPRKVR